MKNKAVTVAICMVFAAIFAASILSIEAGDFWWHLATGKWIVQNTQIPVADPFSYTASSIEAGKIGILKGYWAAQVLMYLAWELVGFNGLIILRALFYTILFILPYRLMRGYGLNPWLALLLILAIVPAMTSYIEIRPKLISYLMLIVVFAITQRLLADKDSYRNKGLLIALPLSMIVWSNMHGGYIIGVGILLIFSVFVTTAAIKNRAFDNSFAIVLGTAFLSILASGLNPIGFSYVNPTMIYGLITKGAVKGMETVTMVHEFLPPLEFYALTGDKPYLFTLIIMAVLTTTSFVLNIKKINLFQLALALAFMAASLISYRYGAFFFLMSPIFIGYNLANGRIRTWATKNSSTLWSMAIPTVAAALMLTMLLPSAMRGFKQSAVPYKTAAFIKQAAVPTELLAPYLWGGYFMWELYPEYRTFIDGRALSTSTFVTHGRLMQATAKTDSMLNHYKVNSIALHVVRPFYNKVPPLLFHLLKSKQWEPAYWDTDAVVFTRKGMMSEPLKKSTIWKLLTSMAQATILREPYNPEAHIMMGSIYVQKGLPSYARESFSTALSLDPENKEALAYLRSIQSPR